MKMPRRLVSATLTLSMLLSLFSGGIVGAAAVQTVATDSEVVYDPLAQTASIAYEQHEDGYAVSLDRAEDSVTMNITAVPGDEASRAGDKAQLYIRTGVELKPGMTYQVGFTLSAQSAQPEYSVCFDGGAEQAAYGRLDGRSIKAGGMDQVTYAITPQKESGELVLRLLLGKTEAAGNTIRFSRLTVGEAPEGGTGENVVLVDSLDYSAPGAIQFWANTGCKAEITSDRESATLTVLETPANGAEVWEIQMKIATGLKPETGKTYRVRADIKATASRQYEICYNEGDVEKGYDVLYEQWLSTSKQTLDRRIYVTSDNENPGELILQFSLGKLKPGEKVTVSNVLVEEAVAKYTNALAKDFAFDTTKRVTEYNSNKISVSGTTDLHAHINWDGKATASATGDFIGPMTTLGDSATLEIKAGKDEPWGARFNIDTGRSLEADKSYQVSFKIRADKAYTNYEAKYGTAIIGVDNDFKYGQTQGLSLAANTTETVSYMIETTQDKSGPLLISLLLGNTNGQDNKVTVSGVTIQEMKAGQPSDKDIADVKYPTPRTDSGPDPEPETPSVDPGSFEARDNKGTITGDGKSATIICVAPEAAPAAFQRGMFTGKIADLEDNSSYQVSFKVTATKETKFEVCYNKDGEWDEHEKGFGGEYGLTASEAPTTVKHIVTAVGAHALSLRIDLGLAEEGTQVTVSDIEVKKLDPDTDISLGSNSAAVNYPSGGDLGSFGVRGEKGTITGNDKSAIVTFEGDPTEGWQRGLFIDGCELFDGNSYLVSFDITANNEFDYNVCYNKDGRLENEKVYGAKYGLHVSSAVSTVKHIITPAKEEDKGTLYMFMELGGAPDGTEVKVSNIKVQEITGATPSGSNIASVNYPRVGTGGSGSGSGSGSSSGYNLRNFSSREPNGVISGDGSSATMTCTGGDLGEVWKRGMFTGEIAKLKAGSSYQVSFKATANKTTQFEVCYNKDGDWGNDHEKGFGGEYGLTASETPITVTHNLTAYGDNALSLRIDLGLAEEGAQVTVSDIEVREIRYTPAGSPVTVDGFGAVRAELASEGSESGWGVDLTQNADSATLKVTKGSFAPANWVAKLIINTGVIYEAGKSYRAKFDIQAENKQSEFVVITKGVADSEDIRGTWGLSIAAGEKKTVTTRPIPAGMGTGEFALQLELGNLIGLENTFTVSNVIVEEVQGSASTSSSRTEGTVTYDAQPGYASELTRAKDSATLKITKAPTTGMEAWKAKLFVDTNVQLMANEACRVTFDVLTDNNMDFEVCYNRNDIEKSFGAIYGLHTVGGTVKTIEKVFTAEAAGRLKVQLSLGMVPAPNVVKISNLKVERISYDYSGSSALPQEMDYRAPGAVSYWAHEDYTTTFTNSGEAITANITQAPQAGAEPWKIKLFLDTGMVLQPGKYYRVTANVSGKVSQDYEICYNNGGVEMGYDSLGGLQLVGGKAQTAEKVISVPADKTDASNLMLQFNLGKTNVANEVTVSGITVEEVSLSYADMMAKDFAYTGNAVDIWTYTDYTATLEGSNDAATIHITDAPSTGAEVWKVKLLVNTGAILSPGKTYLVRADMLAAKGQNYEVCFNNEETEKGFDALYGQTITAGKVTTVEKSISVPASMTDAGELVLQFSVGGAVTNDITVSNVSVQELNFGTGSGKPTPDTVVNLYNAPQTAAGTLDVTRGKLTYKLTKISSEAKDNAITIANASLRADDRYTVTFTARADKNLTGTFVLNQANGAAAAISEQFKLAAEEATYSFTTQNPLLTGGFYNLNWQFGSADNQALGSANVEISNISVICPSETLQVTQSTQNVTVNGKAAVPDIYNINGSNYFKLRDLAMLLNDTDGQFVVRYNPKTNSISLTTSKPYTPVGSELTIGADQSASCVRSPQDIAVDGRAVSLKAYNIGGSNFFRLRDLSELLGFKVDYMTESDTVVITSPMTPEAQEKAHAYNIFFLPEVDGETQPYVGDTMPYYEDGVYYIYYLKEGGDSYNHSVYLTTTTDFVTYTEQDDPVLSASREDVQDNWIGTGSVVKVEDTYYFFYTGFNASGSQEYHEKIMVAKSSAPTSFEKISGWEIVPPAELGQKNDFRDPQAYYDPATQTISLTVTAAQGGTARILKYTLGKDLQDVTYDGIIFTDPTGQFWNLECSDTFQIGNKWYLTYSGQEDTLWYAMADSRFGPYSAPARLDGKLFYAAKHVENGTNTYMVGWARRSNSASSTQEVSGWGGNVVVQQLRQQEDGSLILVPVDSIVSGFATQKDLAPGASDATVSSDSGYSYKEAFTSCESFMLRGEFTYSGTGSFGLAFDFNGSEEQYKLISIDPAANKLSLSFNGGATPVTSTQTALQPNQTYSFTYIQDGSVGIFYVDGQAALVVRLYGTADKPIYLFAENNSVAFTSLRQYTQ